MAVKDLTILINAKDEASKTLGGIEKTLKNLEPQFKRISQVGAIGFAALSAGIGKTVQDASEFQSIATSFERLSKDFGASGDEMLEKLNEVSKGTIANKDIMLSVNKAAALGVGDSMEDIAKLLEIARVKGMALGLDTTQAFNDMVTGIGRGSPLILDNLGIITKGWAEEASAMGVAMDAQFIMNKILQDGSAELANIGEVMLTPAERLQQMSKQFKDLSADIGEVFLPIMQDVINAVLPVVQTFAEWVRNNQELVKNIVLIAGGVLGLMAVLFPILKVITTMISLVKMVGVVITALSSPIGLVVLALVALVAFGWVVYQNWDSIVAGIRLMWEGLLEFFNIVGEFIVGLWQRIFDFFNVIGTSIMGVWQRVFDFFSASIAWFGNVANKIGEFFTKVFESIGEVIKNAFKSAVNWVIDKLNWLIKKFNDLVIGGINLVPGVNINKINTIPKLAEGGIVTQPTLALIGEAGPEAVVPLGRNTGMGSTFNIYLNGTYLDRQAGEKVGDMIIKKLKLSNAL